MCLDLNADGQLRELPKSSKGTIQRGVAYYRFAGEIAALYAATEGGELGKKTKDEVESVVRDIVESVAGSKCKVENLDNETDLFAWGVDSLMATRIRGGLKKVMRDRLSHLLTWNSRQRLNTGVTELPSNVVFENPSIAKWDSSAKT